MAKDITQLRSFVLRNVVNDFKEDIIGNIKILQGLVRTDAFLHLEIPNNANAREYEPDTKNVRNMAMTLKTAPEDFVLNNNGIRIIASEVIRNNDGSYTVYLDDNEGVVNGNHTANVLRNLGRTVAFVPVFIQIGEFSKEKLSVISTSLNSHKMLDERSRQDKLDKHQWVKDILGDAYDIQYHSGGDGEMSIDNVLRKAYIFYTESGNFNERAGCYRIGKGPFHRLNDTGKLQVTKYILKDIIELDEWIKSDQRFVKILNKPGLDRFLTKEKTIQFGLSLHTLSLAKAFMRFRNGYVLWREGVTPQQVKNAIAQNYANIATILKNKKYQVSHYSDVLRDIQLVSDIENLRKSIQIEYLTALQEK